MSNIGKIVQVIGPVVDVDFSATGKLPEIYNALEIVTESGGKSTRLICEVQQHLGDGWVRSVATWFITQSTSLSGFGPVGGMSLGFLMLSAEKDCSLE